MTSKEKIEALNYIWFYEPSCQEDTDKRETIIKELKKDLEILDIFKNNDYLVIHKDDNTFILSFNVNVNEIDDFREWWLDK